MTLSRRKFLGLGAGAVGAYALSRIPVTQSFIGSARSDLEKMIARHTDPNSPEKSMPVEPRESYQEAQNLASELKKTIQESGIDYKAVFNEYTKHINVARNLAQKASTKPERLTYTALETIALMYQADYLNNKAGNNIIKGEGIKLAGLPAITASSKLTDSFYNRLKALENYETVMQIHQDVEKTGQRLPENVGYGMGLYGGIASRNLVNQRMFETVSKLLDTVATPNLPKQYAKKLSKRGYELSSALNQAKTQ